MGYNGTRVVHAEDGTIFVPLARADWVEIDGGCSCQFCSEDKHPAPAFWDTLAVSPKSQHAWTVHRPESHGATKRRNY